METGREEGKELEVFKSEYETAFLGFLEVLEELGIPLSPDPLSLGMDDARTFEELNEGEMEKVRAVLYGQLGVEEGDPDFSVRQYESVAGSEARVPGKIDVRVLRTNREGVFLQEMTFEDGQARWVVGPDEDI